MLRDKMPPFNIEAEQGVLGSALIDPEVMKRLHWLKPDDFYREAHRILWRVFQEMDRKGIPTDTVLVTNALRKREVLEDVGGQAYLAELMNSVPTSINAEYYAKQVSRYAVAKRVLDRSGEIAKLAYTMIDEPVADFRRACVDLIFEATKDYTESRTKSLGQILTELIEETEARSFGDLGAHLLLSGFEELDRMIIGFEPGDLVYLAARPRMGKSGAGQKMLINIARQLTRNHTGGTCDYITLEMSSMQQARRLVAGEGKINSRTIRSGFRDVVHGRRDEVDDVAYSHFLGIADQLRKELGNVIEVAEEGMTVEELRDHLTEVVMTRDCRCVLVDQLDLLDEHKFTKTEQEHVAHVSRALKKIAKDLHIVVICLVQLNRNLESRTGVQGKRPQLADLRMSGRLEMDADMVLFLNRPCVYDPNPDDAYQHYDAFTELWAGKLRENDATDAMIPLCFMSSFATFADWPDGWMRPPFENDREGQIAWEKRLARLQEG